MSNLRDKIRAAQVRAGEQAVVDHLISIGLVAESEMAQEASEQSATGASLTSALLKIRSLVSGGECPTSVLHDIESICASALESPWQPISTAPRDGTYILVTNEEAGVSWIARYRLLYDSGFRPENPWQSMMLNHRNFRSRSATTIPTHWMPLPEYTTPGHGRP